MYNITQKVGASSSKKKYGQNLSKTGPHGMFFDVFGKMKNVK